MSKPKAVSQSRAVLGESPVWDDIDQRLLWVDIEEGRILALEEGAEECCWQLPERVGSLGLTHTRDRLVLALESGFATFDLASERLERIAMPAPLPARIRFNDGKCDPFGAFWAGTMDEHDPHRPSGALYRLQPDLSIQLMAPGIKVSNSLAWSPDKKQMYFADSPDQQILIYPAPGLDQPLAPATVFADADNFTGVPDGAETDREGRLWSAQWGGWNVQVFDEEANIVKRIELPVQKPTSCCFGGADFSTLFVTSATIGLDEADMETQPDAGKVIAVPAVGVGRKCNRFGV